MLTKSVARLENSDPLDGRTTLLGELSEASGESDSELVQRSSRAQSKYLSQVSLQTHEKAASKKQTMKGERRCPNLL